MVKKIKGRNVFLYWRDAGLEEYSVIAYSTGCDLQISADVTEITSPLSGRAKTFKAGRYTWMMSCEGIVAHEGGSISLGEFLPRMQAGTPLFLSFRAIIDGDKEEDVFGQAFVVSYSESASLGSMHSYSVSFQGSGELTNL